MPAKNINLLVQKDFDKTLLGKFLRWSLTYGRYIIICTEIIVLLAFIYRFSLDRKITDLNEDIQQKSAIITANAAFEQQFRNLQRRVNHISDLTNQQSQIVALLHHLEQITPVGVQFKSFSYANSVVSVDASADTNSNLALFLYNLKNSSMLTNINIASLNRSSTGTGGIIFRLEARTRDNQTKPTQTSSL